MLNPNNTYARLFRTNTDAPSAFFSNNSMAMGAKLAGTSGINGEPPIITVNDKCYSKTTGKLNTAYVSQEYINVAEFHTYIITNDGITIKYYLDGELMATQLAMNGSKANLSESTLIGLGDNDLDKSYYADSITISKF